MVDKIKEMIEKLGLDRGKAEKFVDGEVFPTYPSFDINPRDFLQFAEDNYESGGSGGQINALTNARRAIRSQIDQTLTCLGFNLQQLGGRNRFDIFSGLGFVAPRILARVADARNMLEHEYQMPTVREVEKAMDLATLFIEAADRSIRLLDSFVIGNEGERVGPFHFRNELSVQFDQWERRFEVFAHLDVKGDGDPGFRFGKASVGAGEPLFPELVRLSLSGEHTGKSKRALAQFFASIDAL